jgi:hypothetical protein
MLLQRFAQVRTQEAHIQNILGFQLLILAMMLR